VQYTCTDVLHWYSFIIRITVAICPVHYHSTPQPITNKANHFKKNFCFHSNKFGALTSNKKFARSSLFWDCTHLLYVVNRRFRTSFRSHLQGSSSPRGIQRGSRVTLRPAYSLLHWLGVQPHLGSRPDSTRFTLTVSVLLLWVSPPPPCVGGCSLSLTKSLTIYVYTLIYRHASLNDVDTFWEMRR